MKTAKNSIKRLRRYVFADHECVCCEETIGFAQEFRIVEGRYVCLPCFEFETFRCEACEEVFFADNAFDDEEGFRLCKKCFEAIEAEKIEYEDEDEDEDEEPVPANIAG